MKLKAFNPHSDLRIDKIKAHSSYLKKKKFLNHTKTENEYVDQPPWELLNIPNLASGGKKYNTDKEHIFDTKFDGKSIKVKKPTKAEKQNRAFIMCDGKKYHSIDGCNKVEPVNF